MTENSNIPSSSNEGSEGSFKVTIEAWRWGLVVAALLVYGWHVGYAVISNRFFYPDGTQYFVHVLATGDYAAWLWPRNWADHVLEFPLVTAVRGGMTNVMHLGWIRGGSIMLPPLLSLAVCGLAAPRGRKYVVLVPLLSFFAAAVNTEFFLHTANRFLVSLVWAIGFLVLYRRSGAALLLAFGLAVPVMRTYEGAMVLGAVLAGVVAWRARQERGWRRIGLFGLAGWLAVAVVVAARFVFWPNDPTSFLTFSFGVLAIVDEKLYPHWGVLVSLFVLGLLVVWQWRSHWIAGRERYWVGMVIAAAVGLALQPLVWPEALAPEAQQQVRSMNVYVPALLMIGLWGHEAGRWRVKAEVWRIGCLLVGVLGIAQSVWNLESTAQWNRYVAAFKAELENSPAGLVRFQDTQLAQLSSRYRISSGMHCDWSSAYLSVLLAPSKSVRTIVAHSYDNVFKPFDPRVPAELPNLERVGIDYGPYLEALERQPPVVIPDRELPALLKWLETRFNRRFWGKN